MTIFSKKEQVINVLVKLINAASKLDALERAEKTSLEAHGLSPDDVDHTSYNAAVKELGEMRNEWGRELETAKQNITSGFNKETIALLNKIESYDADVIQEYYLYETYSNLPNIVSRSEQIKSLYIERDIPLCVEIRYREATLCYIHGRFDACCAMCRSTIEMAIKENCKQKVNQSEQFEKGSLRELIDFCAKYNILDGMCVRLARRIKDRGNFSIHTERLATEEEALESIRDMQDILRGIFRR
ncbi:MAG: DUF4145 domain-containing protein [Candidatus Omnitrophica bacterium]|nr:DUF4145 domain-containing protein [Candidatus Omnitrophota bacterium]